MRRNGLSLLISGESKASKWSLSFLCIAGTLEWSTQEKPELEGNLGTLLRCYLLICKSQGYWLCTLFSHLVLQSTCLLMARKYFFASSICLTGPKHIVLSSALSELILEERATQTAAATVAIGPCHSFSRFRLLAIGWDLAGWLGWSTPPAWKIRKGFFPLFPSFFFLLQANLSALLTQVYSQ